MDRIKIKSIAKINFGLKVFSKREDGFHNLQTLFLPIRDLFDDLLIEKTKEFSFGSNISLLNNSSNLIIKAVNLLESKLCRKFNIKILLNKRIPIGAGLGGGSSNAASTLVALNKLFDLELSSERLIKYALQLGSDVPFFVNPVPSEGTSRGEILSPIDLYFSNYILLINPGIHISTKEAFSNILKYSNDLMNYKEIINCNSIDFKKAVTIVKNDFEKFVFDKYPEIASIKSTLIEHGASFAQMSGTGSTVYGVFKSLELANAALQVFPKHYFVHLEKPE